MNDDSLLQALPDLVLFVRRDGLVTHQIGPRKLPFLRDAEFSAAGATYQARLTPQGPRRALCVISRVAAGAARDAAADCAGNAESAGRRGFMRRLRASVADAALRERPLAVCLIFLGGFEDIGRLIDFSIGERVLGEALANLPASGSAQTPSEATWYVGQLGMDLLGVVVDGGLQRERVRTVVDALCAAIARPIRLGDASFRLAPCAGIALLGEDASRASALLEHARAAMLEARRSGAGSVHFYSDTLRMLPVARLDIARELRVAVDSGQIGLRYVPRHDLANARITGIHAYLRWRHPLRGEIPPAHFLPIADATGLSLAVSRAGLEHLAADLVAVRERYGSELPISFGALRQHLTSGKVTQHCRRLLPERELAAGRVELRIAERALATLSLPERVLGDIAACGARLVIDELGRDASSLAKLPRLPIWGLQIDRALVVAAHRNSAALRACRAIGALARALEIVSIATGIDNDAVRANMLESGYTQGLGDHYPALEGFMSEAQSPRVASG
jgi:predicted signal transduction protein with EAL and GGDEF domain